MKTLTHLKNTAFTWGVALGGLLMLASCGSYQYSGYYEEDGIYSSGEPEVVTTNEATDENSKNNYYKQYFNTKSGEIEKLSEEATIFTDIESYTSTETLDDEGYVVIEEPTEESYGAWGNNGGDVTINIYDSYGFGWNRPFWWNSGWGWNGFAGSYGWGWNGWGWNYGWNNWGWGFNYGWGWNNWGFNNGFCWYRPRYNNYYNASYNRGRRGTYGRDSYAVANSSRATNGRRSSYSRTENARRVNNVNARRNSNISSSRRSSMNNRSVPRNSRNSNISNSRRSTNNMSTNRSSNRNRSMNSSRSTNSNRSSNMSRSSRSSSRSSGSSMSRGSSSRSSGSVSRGGGSRRGGGRN
ncbi:MAG: hypothetical protein ABJM06_03895 [Gilvibacter sp.]